MRRFFSGLLGLVVVLILIAIIAVSIGWSRIPDMLASRLSEKMKVHVEIDDLNIAMQALNFQKVEIGNPAGSVLPKAFSAEQILVMAPLTHYLHKEIVIDEIDLDTIYVGLEFESTSNPKGNWTTIIQNLQSSGGGSSSSKSKSEGGRSVLIKKLVLTNISVELLYRQKGKAPKKLAPIKRLEFTNVSSEHGIPSAQITQVILQQMLKSVFSIEGLQDMLQDVLQPQNTLDSLLKPFKGILNMAPTEMELLPEGAKELFPESELPSSLPSEELSS